MSEEQISQLSPYRPKWKTDFVTEKDKLLSVFGNTALEIEHIGSTAVEGLASKPIIDIAVIITYYKDAHQFIQPLTQIGYQIFPNNQPGTPERHFYTKGDPIKYHLSIAFSDVRSFWPRQILFRDYLQANANARAEYAKLKEDLIKKHNFSLKGNGAYSQGKTKFIYRILRLAGWRIFQKYTLPDAPPNPSVVEVIATKDNTLNITFDNGEKGILDMNPYLGTAAFQGLETYEDLKMAYISNGAITWDSGVILDTEYIYNRCTKKD